MVWTGILNVRVDLMGVSMGLFGVPTLVMLLLLVLLTALLGSVAEVLTVDVLLCAVAGLLELSAALRERASSPCSTAVG